MITGFVAFGFGFASYEPPRLIENADPYAKALIALTVFPVIAAALAAIAMKIGAGLQAFAAAWLVCAAALALPRSRAKV